MEFFAVLVWLVLTVLNALSIAGFAWSATNVLNRLTPESAAVYEQALNGAKVVPWVGAATWLCSVTQLLMGQGGNWLAVVISVVGLLGAAFVSLKLLRPAIDALAQQEKEARDARLASKQSADWPDISFDH